MAEYRQVEYRIGTDGMITETVINATGSGCTAMTAGLEAALGTVEARSLLPEYGEQAYDEASESLMTESQQSIQTG